MRIRFGPALDFSRYQGMAGDRFIERAVTDEFDRRSWTAPRLFTAVPSAGAGRDS